MHDQRKELMAILQNDELLVTMLANNKAFWNPNLASKKRYSILPVDKVYEGIKTPFVTVQISNENKVGTKLLDVFFFVRCYNGIDKTFVTIDDVLSRIKVVLDNHRFSQYADNAVNINTVYEGTGAELIDQTFNLNFRESQYRVSYLE